METSEGTRTSQKVAPHEHCQKVAPQDDCQKVAPQDDCHKVAPQDDCQKVAPQDDCQKMAPQDDCQPDDQDIVRQDMSTEVFDVSSDSYCDGDVCDGVS